MTEPKTTIQPRVGAPRGDTRSQDGKARRRAPRRAPREPKEFDQRILDLSRVTRVTAGGKRVRFRVALVIGDRKGRVGFGVAKGGDVQISIQKALHQAKKNVMMLPLVNGTFPHRQEGKFKAAEVIIMPAPAGTGLKSGGATRTLLELAGVNDAVTKVLRGANQINIAKATLSALSSMIIPEGVETDAQKAVKDRQQKREEAAKKVSKTA